jgi:hypothetical protein
LSLFLTNEAQRHEDVWGSVYMDPRFLDLGTSDQLHGPADVLRGKDSRYPLYRWLRGSQRQCERRVEGKAERRSLSHASLTLIPTALPRLLSVG